MAGRAVYTKMAAKYGAKEAKSLLYGNNDFNIIPVTGAKKRNIGEYSVGDARYSKGMAIVKAKGNSGFKTGAGFLAETMSNFRYTNREGGYVMSKDRARVFELLAKNGYTGSASNSFRKSSKEFTVNDVAGNEIPLTRAIANAKKGIF